MKLMETIEKKKSRAGNAPEDQPLRLTPEDAQLPDRSIAHTTQFEMLPVNVDKFDYLLADEGIERGLTILLSGGAGTGKTTFCMQSLYYSALKGQKGVYISFEEDPENIKHHMKKNYGWDFEELEQKGLV
ncbi:MAG: ATPase domain-containing protein, partial [Candidatus Diapherotrites archaeon]|nr:ATPase domain-containing protein [Candidatus Diapherotrites archaeon]